MSCHHRAGILLVLLITMWHPSTVVACSCLVGPETCPAASTGDAVFEGTVASIDINTRTRPDGSYTFGPRAVHLRDVKALRGPAVDMVMTGNGDADCGYDFRIGTRYVIVGYRKAEDGRMWTGICAKTQPLDQAGGLREYIQSLSAPSRGGRLWGTIATQRPWALPGDAGRTEPESRPVAAVHVTITGPIERMTTTASNGQFSFDALPAGEYAVSVELPDGRTVDVRPPRVTMRDEPYACTVLDILAPSATHVEGVVRYDDGTAAAGVSVDLVAAEGTPTDQFLGVGASTDRDGRYTIPNLPPGRYLVGVGAIGGPSRAAAFALTYGRSAHGEVVIEVPEDGDSILVAPIVVRRLIPVRARGTVVRADHSPAPGLEVTAAVIGERGAVRGLVRAETAADGGFTLDLFADTQYRIAFSRRGRLVHSVEIVASDESLVITLPIP